MLQQQTTPRKAPEIQKSEPFTQLVSMSLQMPNLKHGMPTVSTGCGIRQKHMQISNFSGL
jgi:hypothetical protein